MKIGLHQEWTSENMNILVEVRYTDDKKNGLWINYYQDADNFDNSTGVKSNEQEYFEGKRSGRITS